MRDRRLILCLPTVCMRTHVHGMIAYEFLMCEYACGKVVTVRFGAAVSKRGKQSNDMNNKTPFAFLLHLPVHAP